MEVLFKTIKHLILSLFFLTTLYITFAEAGQFADTKGHWAEGAISTLASKSIVYGKTSQTFEPDRGITRGEFASVTTRAMGVDPNCVKESFSDVGHGDWYYLSIGTAAASGLIKGYSDGTFRPEAYITREQVASILMAAVGNWDNASLDNGNDQLLYKYRDNHKVSSWARQPVTVAVQQGILRGSLGEELRPGGICTRAEAVVMLSKAMKITGLLLPTVRVVTPVDGLETNRESIVVAGEAESGSTVLVNGIEVELDAHGKFSTDIFLRSGTNTIEINVTYGKGNIVKILRRVTQDKNHPGFDVIEPTDNLLTNNQLVAVKGVALRNGIVQVNGHKVEVDTQGNFQSVVPLNLGTNQVKVSFADENRNEKIITKKVTYDDKAPILVVNTPNKKEETGLDLIVVTGYSEPDAILEVNGREVPMDSKGNFSKVLDLAVDGNPVTLSSTDKAGNKTTVTHYVYFNDNRINKLGVPKAIKLGTGGRIIFSTTDNGFVTLKIYDSDDHLVRKLLDNTFKSIGSHSQKWDGQDSDGDMVGDGEYRFVIEIRDKGGSIIGCQEAKGMAARVPYLQLDGKMPAIFNPDKGYSLSRTYEINNEALVTAKVLRGSKVVRNLLVKHWQDSGKHVIEWNGKDDLGNRAPNGSYTLSIEAASPVVASFQSKVREFFVLEGQALSQKHSFGKEEKATVGAFESEAIDQVLAGSAVVCNATDFSVTPNPLLIGNSPAYIKYCLDQAAEVTLLIKNKEGQVVKTIFNGEKQAVGKHFTIWEGSDSGEPVAEGEYILELIVNNCLPQQVVVSAGYYSQISQLEVELGEEFNPLKIRQAHISYNISAPNKVTIEILNSRRSLVKTILSGEQRAEGFHQETWDGTDNSGNLVGDGIYIVQVKAQSAVVSKFKTVAQTQFVVEKGNPEIQNLRINPDPFQIELGNLRVNYNLSENADVTMKVSNSTGVIRTIASNGLAGNNYIFWDGKNDKGDQASEGIYNISLTAVDSFENKSSALNASFVAGYIPQIENTNIDFVLSPEGDGEKLSIEFELTHKALLTIEVNNYRRALVRSLVADSLEEAGLVALSWDSKDDKGNLVADGEYHVRIKATSSTAARFTSLFEDTIRVEREKPIVTNVKITPEPFLVYRVPLSVFKFELKENADVTVNVNKGDQVLKNLVKTEHKIAGPGFATWNGTDKDGKTVPPGIYTIIIQAVDKSGKKSEVQKKLSVYPYPQVVSTEPSADSEEAPVNRGIKVTFCDRVEQGRNFEDISLRVEGRDIPFTAKLSGKILNIDPSIEWAYGTKYTLNIPAGAVEDYNGETMETPYVLTFTTEAIPREAPSNNVELSPATTASILNEGGRTIVRLSIDHKETVQIIDGHNIMGKASIPVSIWGDTLEAALSGDTVNTLAAKGAIIELHSTTASLQIPASAIKVDSLAQQLDSTINKMQIKLITNINEPEIVTSARNVAHKSNLYLVTGPIEFRLEASNGQKSLNINDFDQFISLIIGLPQKINTNYVAGVTVFDNTLLPIPTQFKTDNESKQAVIRSKSTGIFIPVTGGRSFKDIKGHWAQKDINLLASKLIISGQDIISYAPQKGVTRAQFSTMISRALGLKPVNRVNGFRDTKVGDWYAGYVSAVVDAGIIKGYSDETFRPKAFITRQEAATVLTQALRGAGFTKNANAINFSVSTTNSNIEKFSDGENISNWAREHVAGVIQEGLIKGYPDGSFKPNNLITRAESAVMVKKLMQRLSFI